MDSKGFFLGLIAAVVLFLLWKKETAAGIPNFFGIPLPGQPGAGAGCGGGPGGCASPVGQGAFAPVSASYGMISPGTPPLGSVPAGGGAGSFYTASGVTPDSTFTFGMPSVPAPVSSPTTPSSIVPVRASAIVPGYADSGQGYQQQRYNVVGVPRAYISTPQVSRWVM